GQLWRRSYGFKVPDEPLAKASGLSDESLLGGRRPGVRQEAGRVAAHDAAVGHRVGDDAARRDDATAAHVGHEDRPLADPRVRPDADPLQGRRVERRQPAVGPEAVLVLAAHDAHAAADQAAVADVRRRQERADADVHAAADAGAAVGEVAQKADLPVERTRLQRQVAVALADVLAG